MPTRKERIIELNKQLNSLTEDEREALAKQLGIINIEGRILSTRNQVLIYFQLNKATIVGGLNQWKKAGRKVMKGEHGAIIIFPAGNKNKESGEIEEVERFYTAIVFDISQTEEVKKQEAA